VAGAVVVVTAGASCGRAGGGVIVTIASACAGRWLAHIGIADTWTASRGCEDRLHTQLELIYVEEPLGKDELEAVWERRRASVDRLVVATVGSVTPVARAF